MALPKWITPAGQLGIVPELDYYEFPLDAYDVSGGSLVYSLVSGQLPLGLQIVPTGKIQGVPVSERGGDVNVEYRFTVRVRNEETNERSDRTFTLTITNVAPPIITFPTRNSYLGLFLDGTEVDLQLEAVEFLPGAPLTWRLKSGEIPEGLTLTSDGLLTGYVKPIFSPAPGTIPGWDATFWSFLGWDFSLQAISKTFTFTVEVTDNVNYDLSTYTLRVFPRSSLTADNDELSADTASLESGIGLTIDYGSKHNPIIQTKQRDLIPVRQGTYFSFNVDAIDLDSDIVNYSVPALASGAFDEQIIVGDSVPYITGTIINGELSTGIYPRLSSTSNNTVSASTQDFTNTGLEPGDDIKVLGPGNFWYNATINNTATVRLSGNTKITANIGDYITQSISGANATISNVGLTSGVITLSGDINSGNINIILPTYEITFSGPLTATAGQFITQAATGANARILSSISNSTVVSVLYNVGYFRNGSGTIAINGSSRNVFPTANVKDINNITITSNIGDIITQTGSAGNAVVVSNISDSATIPVRFNSSAFNLTSGNIRINDIDAGVFVSSVQQVTTPFAMQANVGEFITQGNAVARVTSDVILSNSFPVEFTANSFVTGSGNIKLNGANVAAYPVNVICQTDIRAEYNSPNTFDVNFTTNLGNARINNVDTNSTISSFVSLGATLGLLSTEGTVGFDEIKFDQGTLALPEGLTIDLETGWITGQLPTQTINQVDYEFEIIAFKRDDPTYQDSELYRLTVLGDLNNRIEWITPSNLGTIENGELSDLFVTALHTNPTTPKNLVYRFKSGGTFKLPQGLTLTSTGLISGRVSFDLFRVDKGTVTFDKGTTTFDNTYTFTVTASDIDGTVAADRTFTIRVVERNVIPFENLYLKAFLSQEQRTQFSNVIHDATVFPLDLIYRIEDPYYGLATSVKTLFLPGLTPSTLAEYTEAAATNHFKKRILFGDIKTARALDSNFNVKYEVVYLEIKDENTNAFGQAPANVLDLAPVIDNPYYDPEGNGYTTAYPNAFNNMRDVMASELGYINKGALPDWMTSRQSDGRVLGFTRAVVLAYTKPNASELIAYRLKEKDFNFNALNFTVDRYQLDNNLSSNFDFDTESFVPSSEVTFDRYPALSNVFQDAGAVDYAISIPFDDVNKNSIITIRRSGGFDGIRNIKNGQTLVFAQQEFRLGQGDIGDYNQGWTNVRTLWDDEAWDYDVDISDNPYTEQYGYLVVNWTPSTTIQIGYTVLYNGNYYRAELTYNTGSIFSTTTVVGTETVTALTAIDRPRPPDTTIALAWDAANYVPGYNENLLDSRIDNQRIGVWQVNIDNDGIVTLTFVRTINYYQKLYVRNGFTYGATSIYYDPIVKEGLLIPNYSIIPEQINTRYTTFDGNGTRFYDNRDEYALPEQGDKYIKFTKTGVFT